MSLSGVKFTVTCRDGRAKPEVVIAAVISRVPPSPHRSRARHRPRRHLCRDVDLNGQIASFNTEGGGEHEVR
jgi:hypothetical protein